MTNITLPGAIRITERPLGRHGPPILKLFTRLKMPFFRLTGMAFYSQKK
jgi:hypothetical protein